LSEPWEKYEVYGGESRSERLRLLLTDAVCTAKRLAVLRQQLQAEVPEITDEVFALVVSGEVSFDVLDTVNEV